MRLTALAVRHWQITVIGFVAACAMGLASWRGIPRSEDPIFPFPVATVVAVYPGATPADMEQLVADPIEDRVRELEEVSTVETTIRDGLAIVVVEFTWGVDADEKYDEVVREINALRASLPADLRSLEVQRASAAEVSIVQLALASDHAGWTTLADAAERLEERLEAVPGVKAAATWGHPDREVRVSLDLPKLAALGLAPGRVLQAIGSESANVPGGSVDAGARRFNVKTSGSYGSLDEVRETIVATAGGSVVRLGDVAEVQWRHGDEAHLARVNGRRAVFVTATQKADINIQAVRDRIWAELDAFERTLPGGVTLVRGFDQSRNVDERLSRLGVDFLIAIGLVLVTLLPLGFRAAFVVMLAIPLSLLMGVAALDLTGYGINQMTVVGFVIALGLLVDDSIVVVENIARWLREGRPRREAAILATRQISVAVLGCTATLLFAFVPLLALPGGPGQFIRSMPVAVVYTVLASLLVSLTITPFLAALILREEGHGPEGNRFMRGLTRGIRATYAPLLHRALARPRTTVAVAALLFVGSLALVPVVGFSLFPKAGTPQFRVTVETPEGTSLAETDRAVRFVEEELRRLPRVRTVLANAGAGNPQIYYNVSRAHEQPNVGELFVLLDRRATAGMERRLDSLRGRLARYPGARIEVKEFENGPPIDAPIAIRVSGESLDTLRALAARVEGVLRATEGTMYVDNPVRRSRTDLRVAIDRDKAGLLGVPTAEIDRMVRLGVAGLEAGVLREPDGEEHPIVVRLPAAAQGQRLEALDDVYVTSVSGAQVPLRQVASLGLESSSPEIEHHQGLRTVTITAHVRTGFVTDRVTRAALDSLAATSFPEGYAWEPAGEIESRQESFGGLGTAILVAVFGILTILVLEFRTFTSTLIVASVIPLGVVGGVLALLVAGYTLSFTAMIGFVALVGIEIKNSILLVDFTNQLRAAGTPLDEAIQRAGEVRFVPILLTTMTAIGGLLPLALQGSALYSPLAWVIIGGLVSSTALARLVTPVMYKLIPPALPEAEVVTEREARWGQGPEGARA
ncbi:MAG TPA: efflux RND transporter permease subunit [Gemmatimonadaceae bacterium]|nr:efflux RND transporter permease subunit [Gemmatimonadaceae bacterium]